PRRESGGRPPAVRVHPPTPALAARVDARHHALAAKARGAFGEHFRARHRSGVEAHLVRTRSKRAVHVLGAANPAADGERNEEALRPAPRELQQRTAILCAGGDVEEGDLVGPFGLVALGKLDGVSDVAQRLEAHALHHSAAHHVEADDDPPGEHHFTSSATAPLVLNTVPESTSASRSASPTALNAASMMWCRCVPRRTRRCRVTLALSQKDLIKCS